MVAIKLISQRQKPSILKDREFFRLSYIKELLILAQMPLFESSFQQFIDIALRIAKEQSEYINHSIDIAKVGSRIIPFLPKESKLRKGLEKNLKSEKMDEDFIPALYPYNSIPCEYSENLPMLSKQLKSLNDSGDFKIYFNFDRHFEIEFIDNSIFLSSINKPTVFLKEGNFQFGESSSKLQVNSNGERCILISSDDPIRPEHKVLFLKFANGEWPEETLPYIGYLGAVYRATLYEVKL